MRRAMAMRLWVLTASAALAAVCVVVWLASNGMTSHPSADHGANPQSEALASGGSGKTATSRAATPDADLEVGRGSAPAAAVTPPNRTDPAGIAKPRPRVQNRAVPLAQLPPEIYAPPESTSQTKTKMASATTRASYAANRPPDPVFIPGPSVDAPLTAARAGLVKDPRLTAWFDQWQVDEAAERAIPASRIAELKSLLAVTPVNSTSLAAVAKTIAKGDAPAAITDLWYATAIERGEREAKADPSDAAARRRLDELKAAAAAAKKH